MLLPLGILASSGAPLASYELITSTVLSSSAASVTFSSLGTTAAAYKHLQIRYTARSNRAVAYPDTVSMQINGDTNVSNYRWHLIGGDSGSVSAYNGQLNPAGAFIGAAAGGTSTANAFAANIIDILDFSSSKNKTIRTLGGSSASTGYNNEVRLYSSLWLSTAAITSLVITINSSNTLVAGSRFSLYGLRG